MLLEFAPALWDHDTALEKNRAKPIDQRSPLADQAGTRAVQRLCIELLLALELNEVHGRPCGRLGDRLGIAIVVLLRLDIWADILRGHQSTVWPCAMSDRPRWCAPQYASIATTHAGNAFAKTAMLCGAFAAA